MRVVNALLCVVAGMCMLSHSLYAHAAPQHQMNPGARQNADKRRFLFQELRNRRLERRVDNQSNNAQERDSSLRRDLSSTLPVNDRDEKPAAKFNRLSPEERVALRRQIREARQEIYLRQQIQQDKN